jgi:predicted RNA-binding protein with EMAP domain
MISIKTSMQMNTQEVDMTYSFMSDDELTDEQLEQLMKEMIEEVRQESKEANKLLKERLRQDIRIAAEYGK